MSLLGGVEDAVETVTGAHWWRLALRLAPYLAIAGLAIALLLTRQTLERERLQHAAGIERQRRETAEAKATAAERWGKAADAYATRTAALKPLIIRSLDEVTTYAQSPAGAVLCRDADRLRRIDDLDASLWPAAPADGGAGAVPVDPPAAAAGR